MIINDKGKLFGKISIIDIVVLIGIIIAGFGLYSKYTAPSAEIITTETQTIEYLLLIKNVPQGTVDGLNNSSIITNVHTKEYIGYITNVSPVPALQTVTLSDGSTETTEIPDLFNVTLTVRLEGKAGESGYYTSENQSINIGAIYNINTKYVNASATVTNVYEVE